MYVYILFPISRWWTSLVAQTVKRLQCGRPRFEPWVGKIPWRRKWQSTPGLLPGKSHGQRSLVGYSPWGRKESDTTERIHFTSLHYPGGAGGEESFCQCRRCKRRRVDFLGQEDPLEEGMANFSSILAWKISWTVQPGGLQPMG